MVRLICLLIGYAFGLIQMAFILGKAYRIDIRKSGSGNSGTTNALRVLGWKAGLITFVGDVLKCILAVVLVRWLYADSANLHVLAMYTGLGVTLGHNFPFYMKFKGGKGIAVLAGVVISLAIYTTPWFIVIPLFVFASAAALTRYISLGSLQIAAVFFLLVMLYGQKGGFAMSPMDNLEIYIIAFVLAALAWFRHRANIVRLWKGTENKFGSKNKEEPVIEDGMIGEDVIKKHRQEHHAHSLSEGQQNSAGIEGTLEG